jgi:hypothetical protein
MASRRSAAVARPSWLFLLQETAMTTFSAAEILGFADH